MIMRPSLMVWSSKITRSSKYRLLSLRPFLRVRSASNICVMTPDVDSHLTFCLQAAATNRNLPLNSLKNYLAKIKVGTFSSVVTWGKLRCSIATSS